MDYLDKVVIIDTETSDFDNTKAEIIEFAVGPYINGTWECTNFLIKPKNGISPEAKSVSWIVESDVEDADLYEDNIAVTLMNSIESYIVAHNADYDRTIIKLNHEANNISSTPYLSDPTNWICTLKLSRKLFRNENFNNFKLGYLWFKLELDKKADRVVTPHRADSDIYMTGCLFEYMVKKLIDDNLIDTSKDILEEVYRYQEEAFFIDKFPFGKHKGSDPRSIPTTYYEWLLGNCEALNEDSGSYSPNLAFTVLTVLNERMP